MAVAVHLWNRIASAATTTSTTLTPIQTITAANLTDAGFVANDDVLIVWFFRAAAENNTPHHWASILYDSTELMWDPVWGHLVGPGSSIPDRTYMFMERVNLGGTIGDIVTRHRTDVAASVTTHHSEVLVIRLADFGTENTDWFWNKSTTAVQNTTTYSATNRAAVTWTPGSVEDWVYLAQTHTAIDSTTVNAEGRVTLDSAFNSGDWSFQGYTLFEELSLVWFGRLSSLSASSHTLAVETRDDDTGANDHRNSRLLVFRKNIWPNLFTDMPGSVDVTTTSVYVANQVATVTNDLTTEQPLVIFGNGYMDIGVASQAGHMWVRENGATVLDPVSDIASALFSQYSYDATDEIPYHWFGYKASASGTLDLDLFATQSMQDSTRPLLDTKFLVWGMDQSPNEDTTIAVHLWNRISATATTSSSSHQTIQTISAATLTSAGFAANDDVLVVWFYRSVNQSSATKVHHSIRYNGTELMWDGSFGTTLHVPSNWQRRSFMFMERVNLGGTVGDLVTRHRSNSGSHGVETNHSEVLVIRLADFGTENTDWFWNKNTTGATNTTTYTDRAEITWTPGSVEDWVYLAQSHHWTAVSTVSAEGRVVLDGAVDSGDWSLESYYSGEELSLVWFNILTNLTAVEHNLAVQTRDDTTGSNYYRNSRLFVFRKDLWSDIFMDRPGTVSVPASWGNAQLATVTNTLSVEQPLVIFGNGFLDVLVAGQHGNMWVRENNVTQLEPMGSSWHAGVGYDAADEVPFHWFGYKASASGTLDIDMLANQNYGSATNMLDPRLLVWGMDQTPIVGETWGYIPI